MTIDQHSIAMLLTGLGMGIIFGAALCFALRDKAEERRFERD